MAQLHRKASLHPLAPWLSVAYDAMAWKVTTDPWLEETPRISLHQEQTKPETHVLNHFLPPFVEQAATLVCPSRVFSLRFARKSGK